MMKIIVKMKSNFYIILSITKKVLVKMAIDVNNNTVLIIILSLNKKIMII